MNRLASRYALLSALFIVILPHWHRLDLWFDIAILLCFYGAFLPLNKRLPLPNTLLKF